MRLGKKHSIIECLALIGAICIAGCGDKTSPASSDAGHEAGGASTVPDAGSSSGGAPNGGAPSGGVSSDAETGGAGTTAAGGVSVGSGGRGDVDAGDSGAPQAVLAEAGQGSAVALSRDDSRLVVVNRDAGSVTVLAVSFDKDGVPSLTSMAELAACAEPWQAAIHPDGDRAYIVCRKDQLLVELVGLRSKPAIGRQVSIGSEPTGLALTPLGRTVWVANFVDGTLEGIDTDSMTASHSVDLNATLAKSGYLGSDVASRPALAHPRSVAVSNNLDTVEDDETLYATEYFAQTKTPLAADGSNADVNRVGVLYKIPLRTLAPTTIEIPPMADTGINDHNDHKTGCFPNQLLSLRVNGAWGYVVSICASPRLPWTVYNKPFASCTSDADCPGAAAGACVASKCTTNCVVDTDCGANGGRCQPDDTCAPNYQDTKTNVHSTVTVVDLGGNKTFSTVNLTKEFDTFYRNNGFPDTAARRMPLTAYEVAFIPETVTGFFPAMGADAVFRVDFDPNYENSTIISVGDVTTPFIDLSLPTLDPSASGAMPIGIAIAHRTHTATGPYYAFVANDVTRNVSVLDLRANQVVGAKEHKPVVVATSAAPTGEAAELAKGKLYLNTGLNRWSALGQAWNACSSCHIDGLSDNVSWYSRYGPRQTLSLDGTFASKDPSDARQMNWNSSNDEVSDNESTLRSVMGGVGAIVKDPAVTLASRIDFTTAHGGLNGSSGAAADPANPAGLAAPSVIAQWAETVKYIETIRSPRRPTNLDAAQVSAGKELFLQANCQGCHSGPKWTISRVFYTPDPTGAVNAGLKTRSWSQAVQDASFPTSLLPVATPAKQTMRYGGTSSSADSLLCGLRPVGTYGIAEADVGTAEVLSNGNPAPGSDPDANGYNPPSLLGLSLGAPYFHAGGARTLEAALGDLFATHRAALSAGFLDASDPDRAAKLDALVQYLLSIDEDTDVVAVPPLGPGGGDFCSAQ